MDDKPAAEEKPVAEEKVEKEVEKETEEKMEMEVEKSETEEKKVFCQFYAFSEFQFQPEEDSMAEDPDAIPSLQLAWEMIELARVIYKARDEVLV